MKLCVGSGYEALDRTEWDTVDLDPATPAKYNCDVRWLPMKGEWYDEVRAVDILEHLSYRDTVPALREWARVLKPGGRMYVQVPAADEMIEMWNSSLRADGRADADAAKALGTGPPPECGTLMMCLAWRLLGGHFDGAYTRDSEHWYLNAHHALFDEDTIRWAMNSAGLIVESIELNPHPNYLVWAVKPT